MQDLKLIQEDEFDTKFLFLYELINTFTRKLNIKSRNFYSEINKNLKHSPILSGLSYNEQGILVFENIFDDYKMLKKSGRGVYQIAPYFSSLTRLLASVYKEAAGSLGEEETKKILKSSFIIVKKKYTEIPDLEGYLPREVVGLGTEKKAPVAYNFILMDNMIKYLVDTVTRKKHQLLK